MTGALALKNGLSPFATSAFADVPTGTPRSPLFGAQKFSTPDAAACRCRPRSRSPKMSATGNAVFPAALGERPAKRLSYHTDLPPTRRIRIQEPRFPDRGPIEGRPPGEIFAHQRWDEFFPKVGYVMSLGQIAPNSRFHPIFRRQVSEQRLELRHRPERAGTPASAPVQGPLWRTDSDPHLQQPAGCAHANECGFGVNETQVHFHNAHNGAESDGAANVHHFPGTFYDYRWSTTLARRDKINTQATEPSGIRPERQRRSGQRARRFPRAAGHHVVPRSPLLLHRRECLQRQLRRW